MTIRNLNENHDWTWGINRSRYLTENEEIALNIKTRLLSFLGDCFFATNEGLDWFNLLDYGKREELQNAVNSIIVHTDGVIAINEISITNLADRKLQIQYNISTIYSDGYENDVILLSE